MDHIDITGGATPEEILQNVYKQLGAVIGKKVEKERNANTLADAVKVSRCPDGLVGCNSAKLTEATGGILNCPPLSVAPDPLIVDPFGVCYAPESLREEWKDKHVSIDDLINEYSKELLLNLQNSNNLRRAMEEAAHGATNRVAVNNIFTGSGQVAAAATKADISFAQASAFLSVFSDKVSTEGARMLASFVRRGVDAEVYMSLLVSMLYSRTSKASILRNFNTLGRMYSEFSLGGALETNYLPVTFLTAIGGVGQFWAFSLKMIVLSTFSKVHDGYFTSVAAAKNSWDMFQIARHDLEQARARRPIAGGDVEGGAVEGGGIPDLNIPDTTTVADMKKRVAGATKAWNFKQVELAEALSVAFSAESIASANKAVEEMSKLAPALTDVPALGSKLTKVLQELYADSRRLSGFTSKGVSLGNTMRLSAPTGLGDMLLRGRDFKAARDAADAARDAAEYEARRPEYADYSAPPIDTAGPAMRTQVERQARYEARLRKEAARLGLAPPPAPAAAGVVSRAVAGAADFIGSLGLGGGDDGPDYTSDSSDNFYGGEDMSAEMREFLEGGETLQGGLAPPAHTSPQVIRKAVRSGRAEEETADEKKVRQQLAAKGYPVTVYEVNSCPTSVNKTGNTYGKGNKWVETKNPWALCQAQMGYQFKTPHGYCYPEGMSCYDSENVVGARMALERQIDKGAIWITLASTLNAIKRTEYDAWVTKKRAEIRADPSNYEISDKEVEEIVQLHMPPKFKSLPNTMAVQTMVTVSAELANAMEELNPKGDDAERKLLAEILEKSGTFEASWRDADLMRQDDNIDRIATGLVKDSKVCTDVSITQHAELPRDIRPTASCSVLDIGGEKLHVPSTVFARIDKEKLENGGPADPLVMWWRKYDHAKKEEHANKLRKLRKALDPLNSIATSQRETLAALANKAVGPYARSALNSHL